MRARPRSSSPPGGYRLGRAAPRGGRRPGEPLPQVPDADVEQAERARAGRSVRTLVQCGGCGAAVTVIVTVEDCGQCPPEEAEPERIEAVADLTAAVAGVLRRKGPIRTRGIIRHIKARHGDVLDALRTLEARKEAAYTLGPRGTHLWALVDGRG